MANSAVVGLLKAMITADASPFVSETKKATAASTQFEKSISGVGKEVTKLTPQAERMVKAFGGDKLLYQANSLASAVQKLGGVSKLTDAEQTKLNATVTQAIAKYRALGQEAPAALLKLQHATQQISTSTGVAGKAASELRTGLLSLTSAFALSNLITNAAGALSHMASEAFASGARLVDLRDKTDLTLRTLQRMEYVSGQTGDSLESMTSAAFKLSAKLATGGDSVLAAVRDLGLDLDKLRKQSPSDQWETVTAALGRVTEQGRRSRDGIALLGKTFESVAATIKAGYAEIADEATLSTDAQLEALDRAGDAWDKFTKRQTTMFRGMLGNMVQAIDEFRKMSLVDLAKLAGSAWLQGPVAAGQALEDRIRQRAGQEELNSLKPVASHGGGEPTTNFVQQLAEARKALAGLKADQLAQLVAAQKLGASTDELTDLLGRFGVSANVADGVLKIFTKSNTEAESAAKKLRAAMEELESSGDGVAGTLKTMSDAVISGIQDYLKAGVSQDALATAYGLTATQIHAVATALENERDWLKAVADVKRENHILAMEALNDIFKENKARAEARGSATLQAIRGSYEAGKSLANASDQIEIRRAEHAITQAKRYGAAWQSVADMESALSRKRLDIAIGDAEQEFNERTAAIDRTTTFGQQEYDALAQAQAAKVQAMVEDWQLGEQEKRDELKHTHDIALRLLDGLQLMATGATKAVSDSLASMLVFPHHVSAETKLAAARAREEYERLRGAGTTSALEIRAAFERMRDAEDAANESFAHRFVDVWRYIRDSIANILSDLLNNVFTGFLSGLVQKLASARLGQAFGGLIGGGGGGWANGSNPGIAGGFGALLGGGGGAVSASFLAGAPGLAATGGGIVAGEGIGAVGAAEAGTAGGAGLGLGFLANPAFWTNPWTIGVGAGIATFFLAKHFLGASEESKKVSPARDSYFGQFVALFGGSPYEAILKAHQLAHVSASATDSAISALYAAHKYSDFYAAERRDLNMLAIGGLSGLKSFEFGGFTPPHTEQLAIVHGGSMGEWHIPGQQLAAMQAAQPSRTAIFNIHIDGVMDRDSVIGIFNDHIIPAFKSEMFFDSRGLRSSVLKAVRTAPV